MSQLHQLRGRLGRPGSRPDLTCSCVLLSNTASAGEAGPSPSLSRLHVLQKSTNCAEIANADFMLRGPGDMLGFLQSGIKGGFTVDPANHWDLLEAATLFGRSFLQQPNKLATEAGSGLVETSPKNDILMKLLTEGNVTSVFDETNTSSRSALMLMLLLFGDWKSEENNTSDAINTLQDLDASKGRGLTQYDKKINSQIVALARLFASENVSSEESEELIVPIKPVKEELVSPVKRDNSVPIKPQVAALKSQVSRFMRSLAYYCTDRTLLIACCGVSFPSHK